MDSPPPPRTVLDNQLSFKKWDTLVLLVGQLIKWGALVLIAFRGFGALEVFAGKTTFADLGFRFLGNLTVSRGIISLFTTSGWVYGLGQRSLRRRNIERIVPDKNELERILDKNRTSSNLSKKGTTPPPKKKQGDS